MIHRQCLKFPRLSLALTLILVPTAACVTMTALDKAVLAGNAGQVEALAAQNKNELNELKGIGSNVGGGLDQTQLMVASWNGQKDVVFALLEAGADVNIRNSSGWTALMAAAAKGHAEIQEVLIDHEADVNAKFWNGYTPLIWSVRHGPIRTIERLIEAGGDVNAASVGDRSGLEKSYEGTTPLHEAIKGKKPEIVDLLIRKGADVNRANRQSQTPLYAAVITEQEEIVRRLIREGAVAQILEEKGLPLYVTAKIHRYTAEHRGSIGAPDSAIENYQRAAALFEKAQPLLLKESALYRSEKKLTSAVEFMSALNAGMYLAAVGIGALTPYEQAALKPSDPNLKMTAAQYAALEKKYAEMAEECTKLSAECRAAAENLKRRRP
jgi:ankyrin repeat protein